MYHLFKVSGNPANELWEVKDAEHSGAYETHPLEFVERVDSFFAATLYY
jgi:hypothetical protein